MVLFSCAKVFIGWEFESRSCDVQLESLVGGFRAVCVKKGFGKV